MLIIAKSSIFKQKANENLENKILLIIAKKMLENKNKIQRATPPNIWYKAPLEKAMPARQRKHNNNNNNNTNTNTTSLG